MIEFKDFLSRLDEISGNQYFDESDFLELQQIDAQIITARNDDLLTSDQYTGLHYITKSLLDSCRSALYASGELY